jgi:alkanesulfonate monooxygenase SsuD/methylene tetrahydromethanopterin reductase-like flavin-dependent oxidoreductase (luciferase family)
VAVTTFFSSEASTSGTLVPGPVGRCAKLPLGAPATVLAAGRVSREPLDTEPLLAGSVPPLVQRPHPPFLVSAQSEESLRWAAQHDIPFAQIDSMIDQAKRDQALYREVQTAYGHAPVPRLYLMREIYVANSDAGARAEAHPYLLQYWELWNRYTQFTGGGRLPDSYDFWRRQARAEERRMLRRRPRVARRRPSPRGGRETTMPTARRPPR